MRPPASGCRSAPARSLPSVAAEIRAAGSAPCAATQLCNFAVPSREKRGKANKSGAKLFYYYYCFCPFYRFLSFFFRSGFGFFFLTLPSFFLSFFPRLLFASYSALTFLFSFFNLSFLFYLFSLSPTSLPIPPPAPLPSLFPSLPTGRAPPFPRRPLRDARSRAAAASHA